MAKHGTTVTRLYAKGSCRQRRAVATIVDKADGDGAFEFRAHLID